MDEAIPTNAIDYRRNPERYPLDGDDEIALSAQPYFSEVSAHWRYATAREAGESAAWLYEFYLRYREAGDFVGMDVVRRLLRLALRRARESEGNATAPAGHPTAAAIFSKTFRMVDRDPQYATMRERFIEQHGG